MNGLGGAVKTFKKKFYIHDLDLQVTVAIRVVLYKTWDQYITTNPHTHYFSSKAQKKYVCFRIPDLT